MELIKQYLDSTRLVSHHINTYNSMIATGLQSIVDREPPIVTEFYSIKFGQIQVDSPKLTSSSRIVSNLYPNEARKRNISYDGNVYINATVLTLATKTTEELIRVPIAKFPIMVRSSLCNLNICNFVVTEKFSSR